MTCNRGNRVDFRVICRHNTEVMDERMEEVMLVKKEFSPIRVLLVKQAIEMWSKHKMQITRGFTIKMAMQEARDYTGKQYKSNEYDKAINDLNVMLNLKVVGRIGK